MELITRVREVAVFSNGARVVHSGQTRTAAGQIKLAVNDLTSDLGLASSD